jgi:hypothetical protein
MDVQIACPCPPTAEGPRHEFDTVTLHEPIESRVRRALLYDIGLLGDDATAGDRLALLSEGYLLRCIDRWTVVDAKGKALPPSRDNIRRLLIEDAYRGDVVAKAADDLYSEAVLLPLMLGASSSSSDSPTDEPTSPAVNGTTHHPRRSKRSSITTIPTVVTGAMHSSNGGVSSSSPS